MLISVSIMRVAFAGDFLLLKYFIVIFLTDFIIRIFVNPKFSPTLIIGRLIVSRQVPEYVGAAQKKFAWIIGLSLATLMFILLIIVNAHSFVTGSVCIICLIFLFFESAFGICLGCLVYGWIYKEKAQYCPGEICEQSEKQEIQKTSGLQIIIIVGFIVFVVVTMLLFNDTFSEKPANLWEMLGIGI